MEHTGLSALSGGHELNSSSELPARRSRRFTVSQKVMMMWFVLFTTHAASQVLAGTRNNTYVSEIQSYENPIVWNKTECRDKLKCKGFHDVRFPEKFFYWPEDNPLFQYCCTLWMNRTDRPRIRYSEHGPQLMFAVYRDVGYFDQCSPFWKCRKKYRDLLYTELYYAFCEKTDLEKLYWERFWKLTIWKYSLQQAILPLVPVLEVGVFLLALAIFPLTWGVASENLAKTFGWKDLVPTGKVWLKSIWRILLMDLVHMSLLVMVGNGLFEAMRRQRVNSMQSELFFTYSTLYFVLLVILSCTSVVQQLAYWIGSATEPKVRKYINEISQSPIDKEADDVISEHSEADYARDNRNVRFKKVSFATSNDNKPSYGHELAEVGNSNFGDASEVKLGSQAEIGINIDEQCMLEGKRHDDSIMPTHSTSLGRLKAGVSIPSPRLGKRRDHTIISTRSNSLAQLKRTISKTMSWKKIKGSFRKYLSVEVFTMDDDYKWQPIATQATILFALGGLLTMTIDDEEESMDLFGLLLGFFVQAACLWSGMYSVVVSSQRSAYIYRFLMKLRDTADLQPGNRNETS